MSGISRPTRAGCASICSRRGSRCRWRRSGFPASRSSIPHFWEKAPHRRVPLLELDDGTLISEAMAICRYFEALHPDPPLMGADPEEMARAEMWERMSEFEGLLAVAESFRNAKRSFAGRALPGVPGELAQIPELIERGKQRAALYFDKLDARARRGAVSRRRALHRRRHHRLLHRRFRQIHRDRRVGRPPPPRPLARRNGGAGQHPRDGVTYSAAWSSSASVVNSCGEVTSRSSRSSDHSSTSWRMPGGCRMQVPAGATVSPRPSYQNRIQPLRI